MKQNKLLQEQPATLMRLGKFEKWIITMVYKKTIEKDSLGIIPCDIQEARIENSKKWEFTYLFKSEILNNYFDLEQSDKTTFCYNIRLKFKDTPQYRKALSQFSQTIRRLFEKGFIEIWNSKYSDGFRVGIKLTSEGVVKAKEILKINSEIIL